MLHLEVNGLVRPLCQSLAKKVERAYFSAFHLSNHFFKEELEVKIIRKENIEDITLVSSMFT